MKNGLLACLHVVFGGMIIFIMGLTGKNFLSHYPDFHPFIGKKIFKWTRIIFGVVTIIIGIYEIIKIITFE